MSNLSLHSPLPCWKIRNQSNLKRSSRRCGIGVPLQLSLKELRDCLQVAHEKCKYFRNHGYRYRRKHLNNRLLTSQKHKDEESENNILAIIQREKDCSEWRRQNYAMTKPMGRSARTVQASTEDGGVVDLTVQDKVENTIWDRIHKKMFHIAEEAPICQGQLQGYFGYLANTPATSQILSGTYKYPPRCDLETQELQQEYEIIHGIVPKNLVSSIF